MHSLICIIQVNDLVTRNVSSIARLKVQDSCHPYGWLLQGILANREWALKSRQGLLAEMLSANRCLRARVISIKCCHGGKLAKLTCSPPSSWRVTSVICASKTQSLLPSI